MPLDKRLPLRRLLEEREGGDEKRALLSLALPSHDLGLLLRDLRDPLCSDPSASFVSRIRLGCFAFCPSCARCAAFLQRCLALLLHFSSW